MIRGYHYFRKHPFTCWKSPYPPPNKKKHRGFTVGSGPSSSGSRIRPEATHSRVIPLGIVLTLVITTCLYCRTSAATSQTANNKRNFYMGVSKNRGTPKSSHFNRVFPYKPSILGYLRYLDFWKHPYRKRDTLRSK